MSSILKCHFKYIYEKYLKSRLKLYFPLFLFKISILIAHLNLFIFLKGYKKIKRLQNTRLNFEWLSKMLGHLPAGAKRSY